VKMVIKTCNWKNIRGNSHTASRTPPSQPLWPPPTQGDRTAAGPQESCRFVVSESMLPRMFFQLDTYYWPFFDPK
jgi:hypothetical protein